MADDKKRRVLAVEGKEAALESAASMLATIHMAKQVGAEVQSSLTSPGVPGTLPSDLRIPVGDILFGAAQLQVDFARKLFELNRETSVRLRKRLHDRLEAQRPKPTMHWNYAYSPKGEARAFTIKNTSSMSRTFDLSAEVDGSTGQFEKRSLTIESGGCKSTNVTFPGLLKGVHTGHIVVKSRGIQIELLPFEITVT